MTHSQFLAFDFGAGSGRAMLGEVGETITIREVHRFPNAPVREQGHLRWDMGMLFGHLKEGLGRTAREARSLRSIGIDTWGVDFGLIDRSGRLIGNPVAYRDPRTDGMMEKAFKRISRKELYELTGIQFMQLNTLFQLLSFVESGDMDQVDSLLFMPDLFNYELTSFRVSEYTIASTSQLLNARTKQWEKKIFETLSLPLSWMRNIVPPGTRLGPLKKEYRSSGLGPVEVVAPGCHDTASAVAAVPASGTDWAYLSSGTWSLIGLETAEPVITDHSLLCNLTNEGGIGGTTRLLRNVMGLWLLEGCRKSWAREGTQDTYETLSGLAEQSQAFQQIVDPDDPRFINPENMVAAIQDYCRSSGQPVPGTRGQVTRCILESLALKYRHVLDTLCSMTGNPVTRLHVVGGGAQNAVLNQFTADATGIEVVAGPVEATAAGNILVQAMAAGEIGSLAEGRALVRRSFPLTQFEPRNHEDYDKMYQKVKGVYG